MGSNSKAWGIGLYHTNQPTKYIQSQAKYIIKVSHRRIHNVHYSYN